MDGHNADTMHDAVPQHQTRFEQWRPKNALSSSLTTASTCSSHINCHVTYSETSRLYTYQRAPISLRGRLFYSKRDRQRFGKDAFVEGVRIKNLIAASSQDSAAGSIKDLLRRNIISRDELIGIEHFVLGGPLRVQKIRKLHATAVLRKQEELRQCPKSSEERALSLCIFAESNSLLSKENARVRAAMATQARC